MSSLLRSMINYKPAEPTREQREAAVNFLERGAWRPGYDTPEMNAIAARIKEEWKAKGLAGGARKPIAKKPVAKKPVAKKPAAKKPVTKKPAAKKPVAKKPVAKKPASKK